MSKQEEMLALEKEANEIREKLDKEIESLRSEDLDNLKTRASEIKKRYSELKVEREEEIKNMFDEDKKDVASLLLSTDTLHYQGKLECSWNSSEVE